MKIVLIQADLVWEDVSENLRQFGERVFTCPVCDLILLPEMFTSGFTMAGKGLVALRYDDVRVTMQEWAERKSAVVMGSTVYGEGGMYYNRMLVVFPDGRCRSYDKRHCFTPGGESGHFTAGNRRLVFEFKGIKVAVFICYDLRFPVWSRNVDGYDLAVYVANWPESRRSVWKTLLCARAIENQSFVAGVNRVGTDGNGLCYAGDSMLVDAKGDVVGECVSYKEDIKCVEIYPEELYELRQKFPVLEDRDEFGVKGEEFGE